MGQDRGAGEGGADGWLSGVEIGTKVTRGQRVTLTPFRAMDDERCERCGRGAIDTEEPQLFVDVVRETPDELLDSITVCERCWDGHRGECTRRMLEAL